MDKFEYKIKADEIKELIAQGEYQQAADIADEIDWRRVKSVMMLCTVSDLYKMCRRYEDSRELLLLAYDRHPGGRTIVYSLCELSIKMEDFMAAVEFYKEFVEIAPKDTGRYILQYKLYEAQDVSLEERIAVLEELKTKDYREKWAYELAYLYHRVGLATKCVEECDELILWFGEGKYVVKAMELKRLHVPLTLEQQKKYDSFFVTKEAAKEDPAALEALDKNSQPGEKNPGPANEGKTEENTLDTSSHKGPADELEIQVKTLDVGQYNTINLQEELAAGIQEYLGTSENDAAVRPIVETGVNEEKDVPVLNAEKAAEAMAKSEVVDGDTKEWNKELVKTALAGLTKGSADESAEDAPRSEVFFGETGEIDATAPKELKWEQKTLGQVMEESQMLNAQPPREMAKVLSMEADGQISLVIPENENVEKQITGQISIDDILLEWERIKKENEEKRKEEVRQKVRQQTGEMFTAFEESIREGVLERLEKGENITDIDAAVNRDMEAAVNGDLDSAQNRGLEELTGDKLAESFAELLAEQKKEGTDTEDSDEVEELTEILTEEDTEETEEDSEEEEDTEEADGASEEEGTEEAGEDSKEEDTKEAGEDSKEEDTKEAGEDSKEADTKEAGEDSKEEDTEETEEDSEEEEDTEEIDEEPSENPQKKQEVVREKAKVRNLTKEERELYGQYIQGRSSKEQIIRAVDGITLAAYTGNVIVTGDEGMDAVGLAKNIIREVQMTDSNFSGKIAKISGHSLNERDVDQIIEGLSNGALIIQKASRMSKETANELYDALQQEDRGIVVILEDGRRAMDRFLEKNEKLLDCFTSRIDIAALSDDALVAFAKKYAREKEYSIDELGVLALHTRIAEMQTSDHSVTILEVKEIMDEAIESANRKTLSHFFDVVFAKRYDEEDMIILREKDFI